MYLSEDAQHFAHKLLGYLQEADYRIAQTPAEREAVYRLRYKAYLREDAIEPNTTGQFNDPYDEFDNCWIFTISIDQQIISSIRLHVISQESRKGPALDVFPDIVGPMVDSGKVLIDPTRFVADEEATKRYPELPYLTLRAACMASEYFDADQCLATVRREHAAFYRRVFKSKLLCEPRPYPTLKKPICLLSADVASIRNKLMRRYPIFESSFTERRLMFEQPRIAVLDKDKIGPMPAPFQLPRRLVGS